MNTAELSTPALPGGNDFADWLSPILVKELRQGLKTRVFVSTFILVQFVMILLTGLELLSMANGADRTVARVFDGFFWAFVWLPLLVLMPARGLTAVSEEVKANTLDLVQLTHLTAFRIVLGKWIALVAQTLLLVAAILPYAVLRYFFGEVDVVGDLQSITMMLMSSVVLTAGAVALSSAPLVMRVLVLAVGVPVALYMTAMMAAMRAFGGSSRTLFGSFTDLMWVLQIAGVAVYVFLLLEIAASRIAPLAENHAMRKRLLALGLAVIGVALALFASEDTMGGWLATCALVWGWVSLEALTERTVTVPSVYAAFTRRGVVGRLAGRLLYPGWASGLVFVTLLTLMLVAVFLCMSQRWHRATWDDEAWVAWLAIPLAFTSVISPVIFHLIFRRAKQPVWLYLLVQALSSLIFVIASVAANAPNMRAADCYRWLAPFPTSAFFGLMAEDNDVGLRRFYSMVTLPVCGIIFAYLAVRAALEFRVIARMERAVNGESEK